MLSLASDWLMFAAQSKMRRGKCFCKTTALCSKISLTLFYCVYGVNGKQNFVGRRKLNFLSTKTLKKASRKYFFEKLRYDFSFLLERKGNIYNIMELKSPLCNILERVSMIVFYFLLIRLQCGVQFLHFKLKAASGLAKRGGCL